MNDDELSRYGWQRCEFDDECEYCDSPECGSFALMDVYDNEAQAYACGKCLVELLEDIYSIDTEEDNNVISAKNEDK